MSVLKVVAEQVEDGQQKTFWLDNVTAQISDVEITPAHVDVIDLLTAPKSGPFKTIKIQLGLSCNYSCSYCSQSKMEKAEETTPSDVAGFLDLFDAIPKTEQLRVEFWGGEPLVYIKTLKPLAEAIRERHPEATFLLITNGSLLTKTIVDWLYDMKFGIGISHDGPGQSERGDDPLVENAESIRYAVERLLPEGRLSISSMLHENNRSRLAIIEFFEKAFPGCYIPSGEMGFVDIYNEGSATALEFLTADKFKQRRDLWAELRFNSKVRKHCNSQSQAIERIVEANMKNAFSLQPGQKCGMEREDTVSLDLRGNVITCQNTSAAAIAPNGLSHRIGHISAPQDIVQSTATHWSKRPDCATCPVLRLCGGSCMFLQGAEFEASCTASFSDKITQLAVAFEQLTGYVPILIQDESLPLDRQDVWGSLFEHAPVAKKKVIAIKQV